MNNNSQRKDRCDAEDSKTTRRTSSNKNSNKRPPKTNDRNDRRGGTSRTNDVSWYSHYPQLLTDAGQTMFSYPTGSSFTLSQLAPSSGDIDAEAGSGAFGYAHSLPGIMTFRTVPGIGYTDGSVSAPVNVAARNIYTYVRHQNSGSANYNTPDLMIYLLAMDSVYYWLSHLRRAYGVAMTWSPTNRYVPRMLLYALGFNADDIIKNLAQFRYYINYYTAQAQALCVPATFDLYKRHSWLFDGTYIDSASNKAQLYAFIPAGYRIYQPTTETTGGSLAWTSVIPYGQMTVSQAIAPLDEMINALLQDEDTGIMSGDILKAFQGNVYKQEPIADSYAILPAYDPIVLTQIQNLTCTGANVNSTGGPSANDIKQANNLISYQPTTKGVTCAAFAGAHILTAPLDKVEPALLMEMTRLTSMTSAYAGSALSDTPLTCIGTEHVENAYVTQFKYNDDGTQMISMNPFTSEITSTAGEVTAQTFSLLNVDKLAQISDFDWHPIIYLVVMNKGSTSTTPGIRHIFGDIRNMTVASIETMKRLHDTALLSLFDTPLAGR